MKLTTLRLKDYRCFEDLELALEPSTVLVGANNAGKSTILDAITAIYGTRLPGAKGGRDVFPQRRDVTGIAGRPSEFEFVGFIPTPHIIAGFSDLTERERSVWGPAMQGDVVRFGRLWRWLGPEDDRHEGLCLVLDEDVLAALLEASLVTDAWDADGARDFLLEQGVLLNLDGEYWLGLDEIDLVFDPEYPNPSEPPLQWPGETPSPGDSPSEDRFVFIGGPDQAPPGAEALLRPLLRRLVERHLGDEDPTGHALASAHATVATADRAATLLATAYGQSIERYLEDGAGVRLTLGPRSDAALLDAFIGEVRIEIGRGEQMAADGQAAYVRWSQLDRLGAGARRAAAMAALELYRDPDIWPPLDRSVLLLIEEPETGLHPGAQRRVAKALRELPAYGVQTVIVTHSPIFVRAGDPAGLRLVRAEPSLGVGREQAWHHSVVAPDRLQEAADELGVMPSDILLARRFVVVEGESDVHALTVWARTLGSRLEDHGVRVVPAGGHGSAALVGRLLDLLYEGASVVVVLDNGSDTHKAKLETEARFGGRVQVKLLARTEIEAYYSPDAVVGWLRLRGAALEPPEERSIADEFSLDPSKRRLRQLATKHLGRNYDVAEDGLAIVNLMPEREVHAEIKELVNDLVAD